MSACFRPGEVVSNDEVNLVPVLSAELDDVALRLQRSFTAAAVEGFGYTLDQPIPSDADVHSSLRGENVEVLHINFRGEHVGAAVISSEAQVGVSSLDMFFIDGGKQNHGLGSRAWEMIEARYPRTRIWLTSTPYFDTRNIHFYVNKCGFKIVEFFHSGHPDPHAPSKSAEESDPQDGTNQMFAFEKVMS